MVVAESNNREGNGPGEEEKYEHEDPGRCGSVEIVEAAAGQESFGNVFAESDIQGWNDGKEGTVEPDEDHHQSGANSRDRSQRVQGINDNKVSIDGYGSECCNRCDSSESTKESVQATT